MVAFGSDDTLYLLCISMCLCLLLLFYFPTLSVVERPHNAISKGPVSLSLYNRSSPIVNVRQTMHWHDRQIMGVFSRSFAITGCSVTIIYGCHGTHCLHHYLNLQSECNGGMCVSVPSNIEPEFSISDTGARIPHSLMAAPCQGSEAGVILTPAPCTSCLTSEYITIIFDLFYYTVNSEHIILFSFWKSVFVCLLLISWAGIWLSISPH